MTPSPRQSASNYCSVMGATGAGALRSPVREFGLQNIGRRSAGENGDQSLADGLEVGRGHAVGVACVG